MTAPGFWDDSENARATVEEARQLKRWTEPFADLEIRTNEALELALLIEEEGDEEFDVLAQEVEDLPTCYFNNVSYADGTYVCSGSGALLHCEKGLWVREGGCDPDNP